MRTPSTVLCAAFLALPAIAATHDLLRPEWRAAWLTTTENDPPLKVSFPSQKPGLTVSRPGGLFNPVILAAHFGAKGPLLAGDPAPPQVTLANVGDTVGMRLLLSYSQQACQGQGGNFLRLCLANSRGTRQTAPFSAIEHDVFKDDTGWTLHFGQGKVLCGLYQRPPEPDPRFKSNIPTSLAAGKKVHNWPSLPPPMVMKPNIPVEVVFSLTRTGPDQLKVYGFIASHEMEHTVAKVTDFTFDTLYLHYPISVSGDTPSLTISEFQLMTP